MAEFDFSFYSTCVISDEVACIQNYGGVVTLPMALVTFLKKCKLRVMS